MPDSFSHLRLFFPFTFFKYLNYTAPTDVAAFDGQFHIPEQCAHDNVLKCDDLHKAGKLSDKSYKFLKAGN